MPTSQSQGVQWRRGLRMVLSVAVVVAIFVGVLPQVADLSEVASTVRAPTGLEFQSFLPLDSGVRQTRAALTGGDADIGLLFITDGHLATGDFVLLGDDWGLQPAENVVPLLRRSAVERWGDVLVDRLEAVSAALTTRKLTEMNAAVDIGGESPAEVAADWLDDQGLDSE